MIMNNLEHHLLCASQVAIDVGAAGIGGNGIGVSFS
jgi:hypothetical protein